MTDWFKLTATYAEDLAIAMADDAGEVMFTRGLAYCRKAGSGGFIPESVLQNLTRRATRAKKIAEQLTRDCPNGAPGPWSIVPGGYRVRNWSAYNDAADELEERRKSDRERQQRHRATKKPGTDPVSRDTSREESRDVTDPEKRREENAAAAAFSDPLPPPLVILRTALEAHKLVVRWDRLDPDHVTEMVALLEQHGDAALVRSAVAQFRPDRPIAYAQGWLGGWRNLSNPGDLRVVHAPCDQPGHSGTVKHCAQCASEQKAAR